MEKIVIFGAGFYGRKLNKMASKMHIIWKCDEIKVCYFCDNNIPSGSYVDGIPVIHPSEIKDIFFEVDKILVSSFLFYDEIARQLNALHVSVPVYYVPKYVYEFTWGGEMPIFIEMDITKPRIPYLELKIAHHCNLRCKGCSARANIADDYFMDIHKFEEDITQIKKLFSGIKYLKLFGGEPLLHPNLGEFIALSRKSFPDAEIVVHSNGVLIPDQDAKIYEVMKCYNVGFKFTLYPITGMKKREIESTLNKYAVEYSFTPPMYEFRKMINGKGDYNANEIYKNCCNCISLIDGTLSCGIGLAIASLEKLFDISICEDKFENCIDLYTTHLNGWEINKKLDSPSKICSYCAFMNFKNAKDTDYFKIRHNWGKENAKIEDWLI